MFQTGLSELYAACKPHPPRRKPGWKNQGKNERVVSWLAAHGRASNFGLTTLRWSRKVQGKCCPRARFRFTHRHMRMS